MSWLADPLLEWTARLVLALVFAVSAWAKFRDLARFAGVVGNYQVLPERLVAPAAHAVPIVEAAVAAGLLADSTRAVAAGWALALLGAFSLAMLVNLARGRTGIDCGCFGGALRQRLSWGLLGRNGGLAGAAVLAAWPAAAAREWTWLDALTVGAAGGSIVLLYGALSLLWSLPRMQPEPERVERS